MKFKEVTMKSYSTKSILLCILIFISSCSGFTVLQRATFSRPLTRRHILVSKSSTTPCEGKRVSVYGYSSSRLSMAREDEGPGLLASIGIVIIMILFVGTGLFPLVDGGGKDLSIADSVVTRQDAPGKLENFESKQDRLSRAAIQEKLSALPVFYLSEGGTMKTDLYLSYSDAIEAVSGAKGVAVKATSLDQVMCVFVVNA